MALYSQKMVVSVEINKHTLMCKFLLHNNVGGNSKNDVKSPMFVSVIFLLGGGRDKETRLLPTDSDTTKPLTEDTQKLQDILLVGFFYKIKYYLPVYYTLTFIDVFREMFESFNTKYTPVDQKSLYLFSFRNS